jgi:hypothetical protein
MLILRKLKFLNVLARRLYSFMPILFAVGLLLVLGFDVASACDPGDANCPTFWNVQGTMSRTTWFSLKIIYLMSAICGLSLIAASLISFKSAGDGGQQQGAVKKGVVLFVLGGAMVSLPFIATVTQNSALQSGISSSGANGRAAFTVPTEKDAYNNDTGADITNWASNNPSGDN